MGFLRTNYDDVNTGFEALPIGEYECIVSKTTVTETSTKKPMVKAELTVRDDIEQGGQKRKFFDNIVIQDNMMWKVQQVSKAAQLPVGEDYATLEDWAAAIQYKNVRIKNKHEVYNDEKQDRVANWKETQSGDAGGNGDPFSGGGSIDISDDDLPF